MQRALLLKDVVDHAVQAQKDSRSSPRRESRARIILLASAFGVVLAFSLYSWVARPEFIWGRGPAPPPPAEREAGLRFAMFLLSQRVEAYRQSEGSYPQSLGVLGDTVEGVSYTVVRDGFELRATANGKQIIFRSDQPADAFLGNSTNVIQGLAPR